MTEYISIWCAAAALEPSLLTIYAAQQAALDEQIQPQQLQI